MSKPYPGIPAGILDEDLEAHMSKKGPFDAAIKLLSFYEQFRPSIRVLEAAGKIDKKEALSHMKKRMTDGAEDCRACNQIRALLESLPEKED